jgi:hypothetical protein
MVISADVSPASAPSPERLSDQARRLKMRVRVNSRVKSWTSKPPDDQQVNEGLVASVTRLGWGGLRMDEEGGEA